MRTSWMSAIWPRTLSRTTESGDPRGAASRAQAAARRRPARAPCRGARRAGAPRREERGRRAGERNGRVRAMQAIHHYFILFVFISRCGSAHTLKGGAAPCHDPRLDAHVPRPVASRRGRSPPWPCRRTCARTSWRSATWPRTSSKIAESGEPRHAASRARAVARRPPAGAASRPDAPMPRGVAAP